MKKILLLIVSVVLFASCSHDDEPELDKANRTLLAYFLTKDLSFLKGNVETIFEGLQSTTKASTALIYWDNYNGLLEAPCIIEYSSDGKGNVNNISLSKYQTDLRSTNNSFDLIVSYGKVVKKYPLNQQPTDKDVITTILRDMINISPSNGYGLIFGSHGESWIPSPKVKLETRALASTYSNQIDIIDLNEALLNVSKKFDYILMDACMMANIEVIYELQNTCKYFIGSPMEVPGVGFPYKIITPYLFSDNVSDYTSKVCETYASYHTNERNWGNCIAVDCSQVSSLTNELKKYIDIYSSSSIDLNMLQPYHSDESNKGVYTGLSYDILDFVNKLTSDKPSSSFINQLNKTVVAKSFVMATTSNYPSFVGVDVSTICGMGMYIPISSKTKWNQYLKQIMWGDASGWSSYLEKNNL